MNPLISVGHSSFPRKRGSRTPRLPRLQARGRLWTPAFALGDAHFSSIWTGRANSIPLSAPGGGEGRGEVGDSRALAGAHLTLPRLRRGPLPLPPKGRRGLPHLLSEMCACHSAFAGVTSDTSSCAILGWAFTPTTASRSLPRQRGQRRAGAE